MAALTLASAFAAAFAAWCALALWIDGPKSRPAAGALAAVFLVSIAGVLAHVHPFARALAVAGLPCVLVLAWWLLIPPSNERAWLPDVARTPTAIQDGSVITLALPSCITEQVRNSLEPGTTTTITASFIVHGHTTGGDELETPPFDFPISVGRSAFCGGAPLEADGELFRLRDNPWNTEWIRFGEVVNGRCMRLRLSGSDLWRVAAP